MRSSADLDAAVDAIRVWGERRGWGGWDPYDALNSPFAGALSLGRPFGRRLLTQAVKTSPLNLRPLLRIPRERDPKGVALALSGYARLAAARGDDAAAAVAGELADWLASAARPTPSGAGWGYHFPVETRFFRYERHEPNVVATAFAVHALLDTLELAGGSAAAEEAVRAAAGFLERDLLADGPQPYFRYVGRERALIHNANLLACAALVRTGRVLDEPRLADAVGGPLATTLGAQSADGSWPYAEQPGGGWVDNFHTGYVLESLATCADVAPGVVPPLERGIAFWERALFLADGSPRGTATATLPVDAHAYAQAIETWLAVVRWRPDAVERAGHVAELVVHDLLAPDGHVRFERRRLWTNSVPFVRWTTAPCFRALARLLSARDELAAPRREAVGARLG